MEEDGQVILCPGDIVCLVTYQAFSKILLLLKPVSWGNHRLADTPGVPSNYPLQCLYLVTFPGKYLPFIQQMFIGLQLGAKDWSRHWDAGIIVKAKL